MKYFQMGIFVIPVVCLIRKYWSQTTAFFSVFQCFSGYRAKPFKKHITSIWLLTISVAATVQPSAKGRSRHVISSGYQKFRNESEILEENFFRDCSVFPKPLCFIQSFSSSTIPFKITHRVHNIRM